MASLLELLLSHNVITTDQAREAAALTEETGAFIGRILVAQGAVEEDKLAEFLVRHCTVQPAEADFDIDSALFNLLPERLMRRYRVVPLKQDAKGVLSLAVTDPLSIGGLDQVKRRLGFPMRLVLVDAGTVDRLMADALSPHEDEPLVREQTPSEILSEAMADVANGDIESTQAQSIDGRAKTIPSSTTVTYAGEPNDLDLSGSDRASYPASWNPTPVTEELSDALTGALQTLKSIVEGTAQRYAVLIGPDGPRDLVLRKLFTTVLVPEQSRFVNLVTHHYPEEEASEFPAALVIDGLDAVSLESEEEQQRMLSDISRAFSSRIPFVAGVRTPPAESTELPSGLKLSLGLAKLVRVEAEVPAILDDRIDQLFEDLVAETISWSEEAFPGAGLQSLLSTVRDTYKAGNKREAIANGSAAVASRISRLTNG
jgi:hypothetical protein